ncbi:GntR family transcriptional regulator [Tamlana sp. 62-3]|uniref:GntR family transcriptional regulator n=1 Tax=Neotamlana sargassicola TaxID=2883125 RepID=A0A9X1I4R6_9FLAO|nr:GntR family transcriptional regulator [Tamlana sargassicola]MCB4807836.1 GntR family transcriptional regulator [Tamlana sargassicola]
MIKIKKKIGTPKYKQIINTIEALIVSGDLKKGDQIPSINQIKNDNKLSRDTVLMAFNELKNRGIIQSVVGKGYYVSSDQVTVTQKIFLLFDELNSFKEDLYNSFLKHLEDSIEVEIYFHHFNRSIFKKLIKDNKGDYNYYVIMPANFKNSNKEIKNLPSDKVYILDQLHEDLSSYPSIYQNFEKAIFNNLNETKTLLLKYNHFILVNTKSKQPEGMINGFINFCEAHDFNYSIETTLLEKTPEKGELYIIPDDKNLLRILKKLKSNNLSLAKDVGIISYNDTLLKELVEGGITTISTDFNEMGKRLAEMILNKEQNQIENPNQLILRSSL